MIARSFSGLPRQGLRAGGVLLSLLALVLVLACLRAGMGARPIAPVTILQAIIAHDPDNFEHQVVIRLRLARVLGAVLELAGGGPLAALMVNLVGFAAIIGVARLAAYTKSQPWKTAVSRARAPETNLAAEVSK